MRPISRLLMLAALIIAAPNLNGCGSESEVTQTVGNYSISLKINPDPPAVGLNTFEIGISDPSGSPVDDAIVHIHYSMPAMAGMPAMQGESETKHAGNGKYRAEIDLGAGGKFPWDVRVEIVQDQDILAVTQWQVTPGSKGTGIISGEGELDYYTCTMHPSVKQEDPGTCPICAMDLTPVYKEGSVPTSPGVGKAAPTVSIPLYQQQLIGVQWDTVKIRQVNMTIRTVGHVAYNESQIASVNLKFSGWIEKLYVDYTGQFVRKDQPLFEIYSPELVSTQEEYLQLLQSESRKAAATEPGSRSSKSYGDARQLLETARQRLLLWDISETEIERIRKRGKPATQITFYSPITGYVIEKNVVKGRHVKAGTDLYTIADLSKVWVHADIYEYELPLIRIGQKASVTLSYDPRAIYNGEVDYIYPTLQEKTRTARVRLVLPNPGLKLKPEMYGDVEIAVDLGERLTVAETAVLNTGIRQLVFVDKGNGRFEPREIKLGSKAGHYYTVLEGLEPGEVVVKSGNFLIDAEAHVQGVLKSM